MSPKNKICMELVFSRATSDSQIAKIRDFWKYIDSREQLQPYKLENELERRKSDKIDDGCTCEPNIPSEKQIDECSCESKIEENVDELEKSSNLKNDRFWYDELQFFKSLGLDKIAFLTSKRTNFEASRKEKENLILADMVDQSYEEVEADLKDFENGLKKKNFK